MLVVGGRHALACLAMEEVMWMYNTNMPVARRVSVAVLLAMH